MPGDVYTQLFDHAATQYGLITTEDARQLQIDPHRLIEMAHRGLLHRVAHGVYRFAAFPPHALDQMMEATLWPTGVRGVLSHETALDLHDLCEVNPAKVHVTVPRSYRTNRAAPKLYVLRRCDLAADETTLHEGIPIVTPARAILDGIATHLRADLIEQAIETARRRGRLRPAEAQRIDAARA